MKETRSDKFKRIATYRTNEVLEKLRLLGNLSNRANYDYTEEEMRRIFGAIDDQLKITKAKFHSSKKKRDFSL